MRYGFQALPGVAGRARPIVDLVVEGLELAPQACLLDTGASAVRMGRHVAEIAGVELDGGEQCEIAVGGARTSGTAARVELALRRGPDRHVWSSTVYFCEPWPWSFGLLGLAGMDSFLTIVDSYEEWLEVQPLRR